MNMNCLQDIICFKRWVVGIRDFDECAQPESGLFINDLPQISLKSASKVTGSELATAREVLKHSIKMGAKLVFDEFAMEADFLNNFQTPIAAREIDSFLDTLKPAPSQASGLKLRVWKSELARLYIENIYFKPGESGVAILKVYDGQDVKEYELNVLADRVNTFRLDYIAKTPEVRLEIAGFSRYECAMNASNNACHGCRGGNSGRDIFITGWDGSAESSDCFGMGVKAIVRCYQENLLCTLLPNMHTLLWYRAGIVFLDEFINSDRINFYVTFGKDQAIENRKELWGAYKSRYKQLIKNSATYIRTLKSDCMECNSPIKYGYVTP